MEILVYTSPSCNYCQVLKKLFTRAQVSYTEFIIGEDMSFETYIEKFPKAFGYPYVVIDGKEIGGLVETAKLFLEKGLVEPPKK